MNALILNVVNALIISVMWLFSSAYRGIVCSFLCFVFAQKKSPGTIFLKADS